MYSIFVKMNQKLAHRVSVMLLASLYLLAVVKPIFPVLHYTINFGYYANELCENKDKPELACHGTCQLMQKLNLDKENEPKAPALPQFEGLEEYMALEDKGSDLELHPYHQKLSFGISPSSNWSAIYQDILKPPPRVVA